MRACKISMSSHRAPDHELLHVLTYVITRLARVASSWVGSAHVQLAMVYTKSLAIKDPSQYDVSVDTSYQRRI